MRWGGCTCTTLIDWYSAGAVDPCIDLGKLRMQMATDGLKASDHALDGWQSQNRISGSGSSLAGKSSSMTRTLAHKPGRVQEVHPQPL